MTLEDGQYAFLLEESFRSGLPMAELVRRAIDREYRPGKRRRVRGYALSAGLWRDVDPSLIGKRPILRKPRLESD